jgi:hypothetical protein
MGEVERNVDVVRRLEELYNQRDYSGPGELVADGSGAHARV